MAIRKQEAIDILKRQIGKLDDNQYPASDLWAVQTTTFIERFFGEDSAEAKHVKSIKYRNEWNEIRNWKPEERKLAKLFINQCIQTIERIGLYEPPRQNILKTVSNEVLLGLVGLLLGGFFSFGLYVGIITTNTDRLELREEVRHKTDSLKIYQRAVTGLKEQINALKEKQSK